MTAPPLNPDEDPTPPTGWRIVGSVAGTCRSCHAPVNWFVNDRTNNPAPFDLDNTPHFATCPDAPSWRRKGRR